MYYYVYGELRKYNWKSCSNKSLEFEKDGQKLSCKDFINLSPEELVAIIRGEKKKNK